MGNHTNMTLKVPDEYKNLAKELFSINLSMRDTDYPFAHTIPLWRTYNKRDIEDYVCTYPPFYDNCKELVELLTNELGESPTKITISEHNEKSFMVPKKQKQAHYLLEGKADYLVAKHWNPLLHSIDMPWNFNHKKHDIKQNILNEGDGLYTGNVWWARVHTENKTRLLHVRYD